MFFIPNINLSKEANKSVQITNSSRLDMVKVTPSLFVVTSYPLITFNYYSSTIPSIEGNSYRILEINQYQEIASLYTIEENSYYKYFDKLYFFLASPSDISMKIIVYTDIVTGNINISPYLNLGWSLESVNITGHLPTYTIGNNGVLTLTNSFIYPLPISLVFNKTILLADLVLGGLIARTPTPIPASASFVRYNNNIYTRYSDEFPISGEYSYLFDQGLLWI